VAKAKRERGKNRDKSLIDWCYVSGVVSVGNVDALLTAKLREVQQLPIDALWLALAFDHVYSAHVVFNITLLWDDTESVCFAC